MAQIQNIRNKMGYCWKFQRYLGIDPLTGKEKRTTKRGFRTQREDKIALKRLEATRRSQVLYLKRLAFKNILLRKSGKNGVKVINNQ